MIFNPESNPPTLVGGKNDTFPEGTLYNLRWVLEEPPTKVGEIPLPLVTRKLVT